MTQIHRNMCHFAVLFFGSFRSCFRCLTVVLILFAVMTTRPRLKSELELYKEEKERQRLHAEEVAKTRARGIGGSGDITDASAKEKEKFLKQM